jgi:Tol biopolymer transport system component
LDFKPARYVFASGWTSDGTAVIMRGESNGKNGLWQVDVSSGESKLIYESSRVVAWSADGNVVYENSPYTGNMAKREDRIVRKDQRAGLEKEIFRGKPGELLGWMSVSPDGKLFGIMINDMMSAERMTSYAMIPEGGGQEVVRIQNPAWAGGWSPLFFWAPQNKGGAVVLLRSGEYEKSELWFYPQGSNAPERRLEFGDKVVWGEMTFSPDGKFLAFASDIKNESTFWSVENYLPAKK